MNGSQEQRRQGGKKERWRVMTDNSVSGTELRNSMSYCRHLSVYDMCLNTTGEQNQATSDNKFLVTIDQFHQRLNFSSYTGEFIPDILVLEKKPDHKIYDVLRKHGITVTTYGDESSILKGLFHSPEGKKIRVTGGFMLWYGILLYEKSCESSFLFALLEKESVIEKILIL